MISITLFLVILLIVLSSSPAAARPGPITHKKKYRTKLEWWRDHRPPLDVDRIIDCDVAYWIKYYFYQGTQPKQDDFFDATIIDPVQHVIFVACRQTGKTWAIRKAIQFELLYGVNEIIVVLAPTEKQAKDNIFKEIVEDLWSPRADPELKTQVASMQKSGYLTMKNGNKLIVMTAAPESNIRGASPTKIVIDETQSIKEDKYNRDIKGTAGAIKNVYADDMEKANVMEEDRLGDFMLEVGDEAHIWETGTPLGKGHFEELVRKGKEKGFPRVIEQPWWDSKIANRRHIREEEETLSQRDFEAEYCCVFNVDEDYVFQREDIVKASTIKEEEWKKFKRADTPNTWYFYGMDLGQRKDHSVFFVHEVKPPMRKMMFMYEFPLDMHYKDIAAQADDMYNFWKPHYGLTDCTGKTGPAFDNYILPLGWNGAGLQYNNNSKGELMNSAKILMENGQLELWDHKEFRRQLGEMKEEPVAGLAYPRYPKPEKCHDDMGQAFALAGMASMFFLNDVRLNQDVAIQSLTAPDQSVPRPHKAQEEAPWWTMDEELEGGESQWDSDEESPWGHGGGGRFGHVGKQGRKGRYR